MKKPARKVRSNSLQATTCLLMAVAALHTGASGMPDAGDTVAAWYAARNWVDATSADIDENGTGEVAVEGAIACCVILRFDGRLVGVGTSENGAEGLVRQATSRALDDALDDPTIAALPEDLQKEAGKRLTLELEVGGRLEPLIGKTLKEFTSDIHPLHHGLALRWDDAWSYRFPSRLRLVNNWPEAARLESMALGLGLPPRATVDGLRRGNVAAYRFEVLGLAQPTPSASPMEVVAGSIGVRDIPSMHSLADARTALLDHVIGTLWPGEEAVGMMGTYEPTSDRYEPLIASRLDHALTAYALARAADDPRLSPSRIDAAAHAAATIMGVLAATDIASKTTTEHASFLLAIGAMSDLEETDAIVLHREAAITYLRNLLQDPGATDPHGLAMASLAMARSGDPAMGRSLADKAWEALPPIRHGTLMPWIAWAELELAGDDAPAHVQEMVEVRRLLHERQVPSGDSQFGPELVGGFVLGRDPIDVHAQSLRPAAAMPALMRSRALTDPDDRMEMMNRLHAVAGFLLRLQMSSEGAALHRQPKRSAGGIRMACWDNRMPPAAQAMALLTLEELLSMEDVQSMFQEDDPELY